MNDVKKKERFVMKHTLAAIMMVVATAAFLSNGEELTIEKNLSGYATMEDGQIVQGTYPKQSAGEPHADHVWVQRMYTGFVGSFLYNPLNIKGNIGAEMRMSNEYPIKELDNGQTRRLYFYPYLTEADFTYCIGEISKPIFSVTAGYFPMKYNKNSRDLGEYLFRSGTYPQTLVTDFDFSATRLAGLDISWSPISGLSLSAILNTNIEWQAIGDLNLSGLISYNLKDIFEIGIGACQSSIVSADDKITNGNKILATDETKYRKPNGDTALLTFAGTKLMGMASFDIKKLFKQNIFGNEDLKIYTEAAVLGVQNYPITLDSATDYTDITKRIPVMFGFNFPTFKLLDVLSLEGEWFGSTMPNDMYGVVMYNEPIPFNGDRISDYLADPVHKIYKQDNWKWSVYAKRTLAGHFQIVGELASDHLRWFAQDWVRQEWEEAFRNPRQFYYRFKLAYMF
jgi:hypothetical protein